MGRYKINWIRCSIEKNSEVINNFLQISDKKEKKFEKPIWSSFVGIRNRILIR